MISGISFMNGFMPLASKLIIYFICIIFIVNPLFIV
jgi:hypothetical protein